MPKGLRKNTEALCQGKWYLSQDSNLENPHPKKEQKC
jgi:hypothetical protein